jgi:hypothetical protein
MNSQTWAGSGRRLAKPARKSIAVLAAMVAVIATMLVAYSAPAANATTNGCPSGYVCIYPAASWNNGVPQLKYVDYGYYDLSNMFGSHRVYNNQTGGATVAMCSSYGGASCQTYHPPGWYADVNLTPINSIDLATATPGPSTVGGSISTAEIRTRLRDWYLRGPSYSQSTYIWDLGDTRKYRTDCSGTADMALHLNVDDNTSAIATDTSRFVKRYNLSIASQRSAVKSTTVQSGDVFDDVSDGHDFVFASWNSDGSFNYYNFGGGSSGVAPPEYHTGAHITDSTLGFETTTHYVIYRYNKVTG